MRNGFYIRKRHFFVAPLARIQSIFLLLLCCHTGYAATEEIGNSYFQVPGTPRVRVLSQLGLSVEEHQNLVAFYGFFNQLLKNNIYYELRLYSIYHYLVENPPEPPLVPEPIPASSLQHLMGYGGVGILGYQIAITSKVSLMPFLRGQVLTNTRIAYKDTWGNQMTSVNYTGFLGAKLSLWINPEFAMYVQYYAGYQQSDLLGRGVYESSTHPRINALISVFELGFPYRMTSALNITPYLQFQLASDNPNQAAVNAPYNRSELANTNTVYAIKLGYQF